jgi:molybdopterin converting factor small subunit
MTVRAQLFSHLRDAAGFSEFEAELPDGATVDELLQQLYERVPSLRAWDNSLLIGAGVEFVRRDHVLASTDELAIMPPVQGG